MSDLPLQQQVELRAALDEARRSEGLVDFDEAMADANGLVDFDEAMADAKQSVDAMLASPAAR